MKKWNSEYRKKYDKERNTRLMPLKVKRDADRRAELRIWFKDLKSNLKCSKCPENHVACLQFHHIGNKDIEVSNMINRGYSKKRILREMEKCVVLCANCHSKLHYCDINTPEVGL